MHEQAWLTCLLPCPARVLSSQRPHLPPSPAVTPACSSPLAQARPGGRAHQVWHLLHHQVSQPGGGASAHLHRCGWLLINEGFYLVGSLLSFTTKFLNQAGALVHIYTGRGCCLRISACCAVLIAWGGPHGAGTKSYLGVSRGWRSLFVPTAFHKPGCRRHSAGDAQIIPYSAHTCVLSGVAARNQTHNLPICRWYRAGDTWRG